MTAQIPQIRPIKRLLIPLDGAQPSASIVPYAAGLAATLQARLILFRSVESDDQIKRANDYLEEVAAGLRAAGMGAATHVGSGLPSAAIVAASREYSADIIVMTGHAHHQGRKDLLGSTAHRVLQRCATPVLVLRTSDTRWVPPASIVVGLDGSEASHGALETAKALSLLLNVELVLVRSVEPPSPLSGAARYYGTVTDFAEQYLRDLQAGLSKEGLTVSIHVGSRGAEAELLGVAGSRPGSIIVLSTTGLTGTPGVLGSTTDRVVRSQSHPVLAVPVH